LAVLAQLVLFLSSYAPLFGVFALLESFGKGWPVALFIVLAVVGPILLATVLVSAARTIAPQPLAIVTAQARDGDALAYIATYLVPFAAVAVTTFREQMALALFVGLIAIIYIRSELFYVNPLLALGGYRLFQVATPHGASVVLLARRRFLDTTTHAELRVRRLSDYVYWEV
jgi:hypothetical protein